MSAAYLGRIAIKTRILRVVEGVADVGRGGEFLEQREPLGGTQLAARRHTSDAWCSDSQKCYFSYFCKAGIAQHWFCSNRHQTPDFWALGAIVFLVRVVFVKLHIPVP